jgi:hypothetical protein
MKPPCRGRFPCPHLVLDIELDRRAAAAVPSIAKLGEAALFCHRDGSVIQHASGSRAHSNAAVSRAAQPPWRSAPCSARPRLARTRIGLSVAVALSVVAVILRA